MNKISKQKNTQAGFTIIETLVAIFILLLATTGPLIISQNALRAGFLARDQVTAMYLAQESIEGVKNLRDYIALRAPTQHWLSNALNNKPCISQTGGPVRACNFDSSGASGVLAITTCSTGGCGPLRYDPTDKTYSVLSTFGHSQISKYSRTVYITEIVPGREAQIVVEIKWKTNFFAEKSIVVQENIYNTLGPKN